MKRLQISLILCAACALLGCTGDEPRRPRIAETSANLDLEDVEPFLRRVSGLVLGGFEDRHAVQLAKWIAEQPVESEKEYIYAVVIDGRKADLRIVAFKDDYDAPDLAFHTHPELVRRIDLLMVEFFDEVGK